MADEHLVNAPEDEKVKEQSDSSDDSDPYFYQKSKDKFVRDLQQFHIIRGTPFTRIPCIAGKQIDLYLLYKTITDCGGCDKATDELRWEEVQPIFQLPHACTNAAQGLKQIYIRYLHSYEKSQAREAPRSTEYMEDDGRKDEQKKIRKQANHVHLTYNHHQHNIPLLHRNMCNMSTDLLSESRHVIIEQSLLSGLPNEVDFAINVCTLLSTEGRHALQLTTCPRLLPLLLGHVGVFEDGPGSLYPVYQYAWTQYCKRNYLRFWYDTVNKKFHKLLVPSFATDYDYVPKPSSSDDSDDTAETEDLFNLSTDISCKSVEGQRVHQMAMIFRNLSFEEGNMFYLSINAVFYRFLMMCINSRYSSLRQMALDTLGNIASKMVLEDLTTLQSGLVLETIHDCILSSDRYNIVRGLEILSGLSQVERNEEMLSTQLKTELYEHIVTLLCVHDIQLIVFTLECLYHLSDMGEDGCNNICMVASAVDMLVNLMTIEAQSYGPNSLMGIKVVEHVPATLAQPYQPPPPMVQQPSVPSSMATGPPTTIPAGSQLAGTPVFNSPVSKVRLPGTALPVPAGQATHVHNPVPGQFPVSHSTVGPSTSMPSPRPHHITPGTNTAAPYMQRSLFPAHQTNSLNQQNQPRSLQDTPTVTPTPSPVPTPPPPASSPIPTNTPTQGIQQNGNRQHPHGTQTEQYTANWLQTNFEYGIGECGVARSKIYSQFINLCSKNGIPNAPNINAFGMCVRMVFPKIDAVQMKQTNQCADVLYKGIKPRQQILQKTDKGYQITTTPVHKTSFPVMHNTLVNGDATDNKQPLVNGTHRPSNGGPPAQQNCTIATNGVATHDPNLIKSLLANKVRSGLQQNNHMPLLQVDGADSPHSPRDRQFDFKSIPQLDGATTPPPSPTPEKSPKNRSPQTSPQPRVLVNSSPRSTPVSPRARIHSVSPHSALSQMSPPMSPSGRSPKAKYNLEVCVQAAKAAEVVPENHQHHEKRIERVENHCSPSKLDMNAGLVRQLQGNQDYSMDYELEAPKAQAVCLEVNAEATNCDNDTDGGNTVDGIDIEPVTAVKDSQTCSSELESPATLQSNVTIANEKSDMVPVSVKNNPSGNGIIKDNNKLLAAIKDTIQEENDLLKRGDVKTGIKHQLFGLNSNNVNLSADITVGMVCDQTTSAVVTVNASTTVQSVAPTYANNSMLAAQLTGQPSPPIAPPVPSPVQPSIAPTQTLGQTCATNSMGQTVMVRLATPQNTVTPGYTTVQSNPAVMLPKASTTLVNQSMAIGGAVPYVSSNTNTTTSAAPLPPSAVVPKPTSMPSQPLAMPIQATLNQQISLSNVMSAVSQSQSSHVQPQTVNASFRTNAATVFNTNKRVTEQLCDNSKKLKTEQSVPTMVAPVMVTQPAAPATSLAPVLNTSCAYCCQWNHCNRGFDSLSGIKRHVLRDHYDRKVTRSICRWAGCDGVIRQRWAMVTHIQDRHMTEAAFTTAKSQTTTMLPCPAQIVPEVVTPPSPQLASPIVNQLTTTSRSAPSYPIDAAIQAIRRFASRPPYTEFMEVKEGPVTKHIRLTSGLILRNIARYSIPGRELLKKHEHHLSTVALSNVEASTAIAHCLGEMNSVHFDTPVTP